MYILKTIFLSNTLKQLSISSGIRLMNYDDKTDLVNLLNIVIVSTVKTNVNVYLTPVYTVEHR